jgi:hypothetical protein
MDGLLAGLVIGVPPILNYGSPELSAKVIPDVRWSLSPHNSVLNHTVYDSCFRAKNTLHWQSAKPLLAATSADCKQPLPGMAITG